MWIRKVTTRKRKNKTYYSHRLVHSVRIGDTVEQVTLLNLGAQYPFDENDWPASVS